MMTRPDITFSTAFLSKYLDKPTESLWKAGKRILRYLKETKDMELTYTKSNINNLSIKAYSDSDWAGDVTDRKSVSGSVIYYGDNAISWFSRKQHCVALSSCEAEYIAAAETASELLFVKGIVQDLCGESNTDTYLCLDNQSALKMTLSYENSKRAKHIDIKIHFIKDIVQKGLIKVKYVKSENNVADIFTKSVVAYKFIGLRKMLKIE